jgi:uncharacterized protein (DUF885 family)
MGTMKAMLLMCLAFTASAFQAPPAAPPEFDLSLSEMRPLIESFSADRGNLLRTYNLQGSAAQRDRLKQFYSDWQKRLAALPFDTFGQDGKIDYVLLRRYLEREIQSLDLDARDQAETARYTPFAASILSLEESRKKMEPVKSAEAGATLSALVKQIEEIRRSVDSELRGQGAPDQKRRVLGARAAANVTSLRNSLRTWFNFYDGYDPIFTWWTQAPYREVDAALNTYTIFLRERVAGLRPLPAETADGRGGNGRGGAGGNASAAAAAARPGESDDIIGSPIGRDGLMNELAFEMIPYTPEELIAIAEKEFAWCEAEMKRASREMGFGDDWKKALEKVKNMYVDPGKQPELIRDLALEAIKFVDDHDLITIPPLARETWRMNMMSPQQQLVNPFFTGGETITVSYPTNAMSHEQKMMSMRGNNIPFARATVFHELIPGHELQGFIAARFRPYRSALGSTPFITEGWALYWELLLYDMKFHKTPEDRVGALFWRMHRCARIIFSLSFHLGKMTPEECIKFLVDRVGHEPENATAEVRRSFGGDYGPLYQAAYLLGGMQLYALHKELVNTGKMTNRQFHDAVLRENRMPVELIRASLAKQPVTRDYTTKWRFYGESSR